MKAQPMADTTYDQVKSENAVMRGTIEDYFVPETIAVNPRQGGKATLIAVPRGMELRDASAFQKAALEHPERRTGTAKFTDLSSFIEHAVRFKNDNSVIYAVDDPKNPSLTSIIDYHEVGGDVRAGTHWGAHRGRYAFPFSETWKAWQKVEDGGALSMGEFAEFLEDRIGDVIEPLGAPYEGEPDADKVLRETIAKLGGILASPAILLDLSRSFRVNENSKTRIAQVLSSGEAVINFSSEHLDDVGAPIRVPNMFLIQAPVFANGIAYRVPVRLRYRAVSGTVKWLLMRLRPDLYLNDALEEAITITRTGTGLPVFRGTPEE